jgi:hypothetical protein
VKTLVPFVLSAIAKKHTFFRTEFKFAVIISMRRPTSTTKDFLKSIVSRFIE